MKTLCKWVLEKLTYDYRGYLWNMKLFSFLCFQGIFKNMDMIVWTAYNLQS
jgi:hypothetical protein